MPLENDLTEAEDHYLKTGGDVTDALIAENKEAPAEPVVEPPPIAPEQAPPAAAVSETDDDDADEAPAAQAPADGQQQPQQRERRRVSRREFESERQARLKAEQTLQEQAVRNARVEERLSLLQQALQEPTQPDQPQAEIDPEQDIFGAYRQTRDQLKSLAAEVNAYKEQLATGQAEMEAERRYFDSLNRFAGKQPDFLNAYHTAIRGRAAQLVGESYSDVTDEQLAGIREGTIGIPQPIADQLRQEERSLYRTAFEQNRDPGAVLYRYAQSFGYRPPQQPKPNGAAPASAPLGGEPAAQPAPTAPARAAGTPTATDVINSIQRGQAAATSLSKAGGSAPDAELTPQALADMSEEQFAALFNELQARGDRQKLMQLFGG